MKNFYFFFGDVSKVRKDGGNDDASGGGYSPHLLLLSREEMSFYNAF